MLYQAGDRAAALRQYERCVTALAEELDVKPSKRTVAVYECIRADELPATSQLAQGRAETAPDAPPPTVAQVRQHLTRIEAVLDEARQKIQEESKRVQQTLKNWG
jgi:hypothetical protein